MFETLVALQNPAPDLWWDNQKTVKDAKTVLLAQNYKGKTLFMAMANRLEKASRRFISTRPQRSGDESRNKPKFGLLSFRY